MQTEITHPDNTQETKRRYIVTVVQGILNNPVQVSMFTLSQKDNRFHLDMLGNSPALHALYRVIQPGVEKFLAFDRLSDIATAAELLTGDQSPENRILQVLDAQCKVEEQTLQQIPAEGPLIVVANHPFGGIEGLLLASLLKRRRNDVRIMANTMLGTIAQLRDLFILVDPFGTPSAAQRNIGGIKKALQWLKEGGVLGIFPAGEVSHYNLARRDVLDPEWHEGVGRIVQRSGAPVLPVYFEGNNSTLFQTLGLLHPRLRTMRLPHEFLNKQGLRTVARIGNIILPARIKRLKTAQDVTTYLRIRTYLHRHPDVPTPTPPGTSEAAPIVPAVPTAQLQLEIAALPEECLLLEHERFQVFVATAAQLPFVLREIGRLREMTFRTVDEGTGLEIDLDRFDEHYLHLFLWNGEHREIVAAYRLGQTDVILEQHGKHGLYTRTLFNIRKRLLSQISPALEMGRSFVRVEYQRQFLPLMLLWRGIGTYVARNPRYRNLFGPVSISNAYTNTSRQLLVQYFQEQDADERARLVRAITPPRSAPLRGFDPKTMSTVLRDLSDLSTLISEIEQDKKEIPILLKQYLKLGGVLLGFNVDAAFSNALDGLILVDLTKSDTRLLERYMGTAGAGRFLSYWKSRNA